MMILCLLSCSILLVLMAKSPFLMSLGLVSFSFALSLFVHSVGYVWVTYTLVIMFLGGMMIVFIYASSLNSVFKLIIKIYKILMFSASLMALSLIVGGELLMGGQLYSTPVWLNFCCSSLGVLCMMALLVLFTLFIVVKLVQVSEGPLKF